MDATMLDLPVQSFFLHSWLARIARRPLVVLTLIVGITPLSACKIPWMTFSVAVNDLVVADVPERHQWNDFKSIFGSDEIIRVVVKSDDFFTPQSFARLSSLSVALEKIPGVGRVISLPQVKTAVDPQGKWGIERFARLTTPVQTFQRNLISPDRRVAGITLVLNDGADQEMVTRAVDSILGSLDKSLSGYQIGIPTVSITLARYAQRDVMHLPLFTVLIIALLLIAMFRHILAVVLPLLCVAISCL
jgi:predicted RND superfamily exporter protein